MSDKPEPEKIWEMAVMLMAGRCDLTPSQAVELAVRTWETAAEQTSEDSVSSATPIRLPAPASLIWHKATGIKRSENWTTFPRQVEKWCKAKGLHRHDLLETIKNELKAIFGSDEGPEIKEPKPEQVDPVIFSEHSKRSYECPDTPVMRFVVDLLCAVYRKHDLCLGHHLRFFDLDPHRGKTIISLTYRGTILELDEPIAEKGNFEQLAGNLFDHLYSHSSDYRPPIDPGDLPLKAQRILSPGLAPLIESISNGVGVSPSSETACEVEQLVLSSGTILLPGFRPHPSASVA